MRDAVRLFHDNISVNEYNSRAIRHPEYESIARDSFAGYKTEEELAKARKELYRMKITECLGFPYSIRLAKGYPYMITSNIDVDEGLVNGGEQNPSSSVQRQVHGRHVHVRNNFCIISQGQRWGTEPLQLCPETGSWKTRSCKK